MYQLNSDYNLITLFFCLYDKHVYFFHNECKFFRISVRAYFFFFFFFLLNLEYQNTYSN